MIEKENESLAFFVPVFGLYCRRPFPKSASSPFFVDVFMLKVTDRFAFTTEDKSMKRELLMNAIIASLLILTFGSALSTSSVSQEMVMA
jgi:hypothetical protein